MESFMKMTSAKSHRELKDEGILIEYREDLGHSMFVSHQWASFDHPDPQFQQLSVLQQVLSQLLTTDMPINSNIMTRVALGYSQCIFPQEWRERPLLIWYDYFSIPQLEVRNQSVTPTDLQNAVDSIPTYVKHLGSKETIKTLFNAQKVEFQGNKNRRLFWILWQNSGMDRQFVIQIIL